MIVKNRKNYAISTSNLASSVVYNNSKSGMSANNVQDGLDELSAATNNMQNGLDELHSNLTSDIPFRFGKNELGEYGYIVTDSEGADSVIPFKNGVDVNKAFTGWTLITKVESKCPDRGAEEYQYENITEDGIYLAIFSVGGNGTAQRGHVFTTDCIELGSYNSHDATGYVCLVSLKFLQAKSGDTITYAFPKQNESRGTFLLYKLNL